ncbi:MULTISPECIES: DUF418 domain-containing protein [unclassified Nocardiopsis]|uniref:DUF418 domain-containing protein n=1 Tax=Nocardiopsis TaxID=2013 RepID=UPI00387B4E36
MAEAPVHTAAPGAGERAGPVPAARRLLAPDLARGVMLLVIALAHVHIFSLFVSGENSARDTLADQVVTAATVMFVDFRGYPMFAALFGYGLAQIYARRTARGLPWPRIRSLVRRRGRWLVLFGVVHAALLFLGDILAVYGLIALVFAGVLHWRDRSLAALAVLWLPLPVVMSALEGYSRFTSGASYLPPVDPGVLNELVHRLTVFPFMAVIMFANTVVPFAVGVLAARHRVLEEPQRHLGLLRTAALAGIPLAALGGLPTALAKAGVWTDPTGVQALLSVGAHQLTGYAGGLGYAALIALVAVRAADRRGPAVTALAALGQRSMTFYLAQSVVWTVLFASYTLHLAVSPPVGAGIAVAVWASSAVAADFMRRRGLRGPAEVALRRLTYGRPR